MKRPVDIIMVLCTSATHPPDTLHKKTCRIGPGLCGTSEDGGKVKFAEFTFRALR